MLHFNFIEGASFPGGESPRLPLSRDVTPFGAEQLEKMAKGEAPEGMTLQGVGALPRAASAGPPQVSPVPAAGSEALGISERPTFALADTALQSAALRFDVPSVSTNSAALAESGVELADAIATAASSEPPPIAKVDRPPRPEAAARATGDADSASAPSAEAKEESATSASDDAPAEAPVDKPETPAGEASPQAKAASSPPWERSKTNAKEDASEPADEGPQTKDSAAPASPSADSNPPTSADMPPITSPISEPTPSPAPPPASGGDSLPGLAQSIGDSGPRKTDSSPGSGPAREPSSRPPRSSDHSSRGPSRPPSSARRADTETRPGEQGGFSGIKLVLLTVAAAAASYLVVKAIVPRSETAERTAAQPTATQVAPAPPVAKSVVARPAALEPKIEELPIPPGMVVPEDKGLLEVDTAGKHGIYVDGTFVGRGPLRQVPLAPGSHAVRAELDADQLNATVDVRKGRRSRLSFAAR